MRSSLTLYLLTVSLVISACGAIGQNHGPMKPFESSKHDDSTDTVQSQNNGPYTTVNAPVPAPVPAPLPAPVYIPQPGDSFSRSSATSPIRTLYVIVSGNATCRPAILGTNDVSGLTDNSLFQGFIATMMTPGYVTQEDNVIFACYETLSPQMQVYDVRNRPQMVPINEAELEGIVMPQAYLAQRIVIMGHSYGGWKSMKMASSAQLLPYTQAPIQLITIDPISKINCTNPFMPGCRQAPSDFTNVEFSTLHSRTRWLNAVQQPGVVLGSESMPAAHTNLEFTGVNHFTIVSDPRLWQAIHQFVAM